MGMDSMAGFAMTVEEEVLSSKFPNEWAKLASLLENSELDPQEISTVTDEVMEKGVVTRDIIEKAIGDVYDEEVFKEAKELLEAWLALGNTFKKDIGMTLYLGYQDGDLGSEHDDIRDWFFSLNFLEVYEVSNKMKKAMEKGVNVEMSFFTTYG